jgi:hypothetical protein
LDREFQEEQNSQYNIYFVLITWLLKVKETATNLSVIEPYDNREEKLISLNKFWMQAH